MNKLINFNNNVEIQKHLPADLIPKVTILLQDSGYISISPNKLNGVEWRRFNEKVKQMGGIWLFDSTHPHWSIPWS